MTAGKRQGEEEEEEEPPHDHVQVVGPEEHGDWDVPKHIAITIDLDNEDIIDAHTDSSICLSLGHDSNVALPGAQSASMRRTHAFFNPRRCTPVECVPACALEYFACIAEAGAIQDDMYDLELRQQLEVDGDSAERGTAFFEQRRHALLARLYRALAGAERQLHKCCREGIDPGDFRWAQVS